MTDCEYIKLCEEAFGATVPGCKNDHWRGCPNYDLCVLVHNQAIEDFKLHLLSHRPYLTGHLTEGNVTEIAEALKKPPSQEGE